MVRSAVNQQKVTNAQLVVSAYQPLGYYSLCALPLGWMPTVNRHPVLGPQYVASV